MNTNMNQVELVLPQDIKEDLDFRLSNQNLGECMDIEVIIEKIENELYTSQLLEEFMSETVFHTDLVYAYLNPVTRQCFKKSNILYKKNSNKEMK
ncbi:hypothetical protein QR692_10265 [Lactococcus petauri]|uniref:hypothetical protein n=1 Tax=Lactococcus petauri TaxID=1940789 RepID=UPI00207905DD|nr:hypothetical protein [Lactococcus petauri]USI65367.1 hypothetical protein LMK05_11150 [Lactococcus petauri]USI67862.1 hypothetical protein LMK04_10385 [Lactococcus petauri]WJE12523.1 hypothetical protein QR692_10265 [Lactococcus petauri]